MKPSYPSVRSQSRQGGGGQIDTSQLMAPKFHGGQNRQKSNSMARGKASKQTVKRVVEVMTATDENYPTATQHETTPPLMIFSNSNQDRKVIQLPAFP